MEIHETSATVTALLAQRNTEKANKPQERMVNIRREIDPVYRNIVARIEALSLIEGDAAYAPFINELNVLVERFNLIRPHRAGKNDKANSAPS